MRRFAGLIVSLKNLSDYRKKRDFEKTAEPSGDAKVAPSTRRRFVIQKHDATRLHYDLRLEFDGVFKSWAVTRGPSLDPHDKRLAVEVENHPLDYGDFEGTIPEGQYGGGTVQLWDRGYWESDDPERGFKKGDLKFTLYGEKLGGSWVLVRMRHDRDGGKRTNWLLIKHRDEFAREGKANNILDADQSVASGRTMAQIAAGKGKAPKPFMTAKSSAVKADAVWHSNRGAAADMRAANKPGKSAPPPSPKGRKVAALPDFIAPQLCTLVERPPSAGEWCHEIKFDGYRVQLRVEGGKASLKTRKGLDWTDKFGAIAKEASGLPDGLVDGEIVALDANGAPDFSQPAGRAVRRQHRRSDFLRVRSLVRRGHGSSRATAFRTQGTIGAAAGRAIQKQIKADPLCRAFRGGRRRGAAIGAPAVAGGDRLQEAQLTLSIRPLRELDQDQVPRRTRGRAGRLENHQRQIPLADGGRLSRRSSGLCRAWSAPASGRTRSGACCRR
jgi:DNA ligase D-like protein (predicted 3'-phosphoesterase)